jgi:hypothetical protein
MAQGQGQWTSDVPFKRFANLTSGQTFGPFASPPSEALDGICISQTLASLAWTGSDGVTVTFSVMPNVGTVFLVSPTSITFTPVNSVIGLYR